MKDTLAPHKPAALPVEIFAGQVITGEVLTTKFTLLVPVPPGVVTEITPVVAPAGRVAVIWFGLLTTKEAVVPLKLTIEAPVKPDPVMTTLTPEPAQALGGAKPLITGPEAIALTVPSTESPAVVYTYHVPPLAPPVGSTLMVMILGFVTFCNAAVVLRSTGPIAAPLELVDEKESDAITV